AGPAGAEPVFGREPAGAFVFVVDDDDDPGGPERGRGRDLGDFGGEEVVELGVALVDRFAVRLAVVAPVGDDHVEAGHPARGQIGVEGGHPRFRGARRDVVGQAFPGTGGGGPAPGGALDVVERDGGVPGGVDPGQGEGFVAGAAAPGPGVAFGGPRLQPYLPGQPGQVQLVEQVVDVLVAGDAPIVLLAPGELPGDQCHIVGLRPGGRGGVVAQPRSRLA